MNIVLEGIVGSTAYGLSTPDSDVDKLGIIQLPTSHFLGLSSPSESSLSHVSTEPDVTYHDIGKFCRLALSCNPTVTELLWLPDDLYTVRTELGDLLIQTRNAALSAKRVHDAYMGYAVAQFKRLTERGDFGSDMRKRTEKHARHLLRLMHQGYTLYTTGELPIRLENPERYHEFGRVTADVPSHAESTIEAYKEAFAKADTVLPEKPNVEFYETIILNTRINYLRSGNGLE
jgi:predicted nucleotidyltransferase